MTPRHSLCLGKGVLARFDLPSYVGRSGDDERKVEQEERMKSQTYQQRLAFSGAFADPQTESGHAATTKVEVQLLGSHAKGKPCK